MSEILDLLGRLVEINTVNDPRRGVKPSKEAALFIRDWLLDNGLEPEIIESNGYYTVFGSIGSGDPVLLVMAHCDVVPFNREEWSYEPLKLTVVDGKAYGRGALDDKSNVAALLLVLRELSKMKLEGRVFYAFTGDEETGGMHGAAVVAEKLASQNMIPKYLLNADGYGMKMITRRRKVFNIIVSVPEKKVKVKGSVRKTVFEAYYPVAQHSHAAYFIAGADSHPLITASVMFRKTGCLARRLEGSFVKTNVVPRSITVEYVEEDAGEDRWADEGLTKLLKAIIPLTRVPLRTEKPSEYGVSITPNIYMHEEGKHTIILDIRAMVSEAKSIEESFKNIINEVLPEAEIEVQDPGGGYQYTPASSLLVKALSKALQEEGEKPETAEGAGASDSRHFTPLGVEAVDFGPRGGGVHGVDEYVDVKSLEKLPSIYLRTIRALLSK